jgi:hypothetical protein
LRSFIAALFVSRSLTHSRRTADEVAALLGRTYAQVETGRLDPAFASAAPLAPLSPLPPLETAPSCQSQADCSTGCACDDGCDSTPTAVIDPSQLQQPQTHHRFGRVGLPDPSQLMDNSCILFIGGTVLHTPASDAVVTAVSQSLVRDSSRPLRCNTIKQRQALGSLYIFA